MKKKGEKKEFKAVDFMRKRRDELSKLYANDPKEFSHQLEEVRKKYKHLFKQKNSKKAA